MSLEEIKRTPTKDLNEYCMAIDKIEAHEELIAIRVSGFPHWKDSNKRDRHMDNLRKKATLKEAKQYDNKDIAKRLGFL